MTSHILSKLYWPLTPAPSSRVQDGPWVWALARDLHPLVWWILLGVAFGFASSSYFYHRRVLVFRFTRTQTKRLALGPRGRLTQALPCSTTRISTSSRTGVGALCHRVYFPSHTPGGDGRR